MTIQSRRLAEIEAIELTPEEKAQALFSAKHKKWNEQRNKEHWEALEKGRKGAFKDDEGAMMGTRY